MQPVIATPRLVLRAFAQQDAHALLLLLGNREVNRFLPMLPLATLQQAEQYLQTHYLQRTPSDGYAYAICLREDDVPIGYVHAGGGESHDFGYALRQEFWHRGIVTEAARALVQQLRQTGVPFITATHDVNNPRSGQVMQNLGMTYRYSYEELWQPKNIPVTFRMYQLNLDGDETRVYRGYWEKYPVHFVEDGF